MEAARIGTRCKFSTHSSSSLSFSLNKKRRERKRERMLMVAGQSYIVLSGGLGSSKYVQTKIEEYYQRRSIPVLFSTDPGEPYVPSSPFPLFAKRLYSPLAVCKGLVIDRMQRLCHGI